MYACHSCIYPSVIYIVHQLFMLKNSACASVYCIWCYRILSPPQIPCPETEEQDDMSRSDSELQTTAPLNYAETKKPDAQVKPAPSHVSKRKREQTASVDDALFKLVYRAGFGDPTVMPAGRPGVTIEPETPHIIQPVDCGGDWVSARRVIPTVQRRGIHDHHEIPRYCSPPTTASPSCDRPTCHDAASSTGPCVMAYAHPYDHPYGQPWLDTGAYLSTATPGPSDPAVTSGSGTDYAAAPPTSNTPRSLCYRIAIPEFIGAEWYAVLSHAIAYDMYSNLWIEQFHHRRSGGTEFSDPAEWSAVGRVMDCSLYYSLCIHVFQICVDVWSEWKICLLIQLWYINWNYEPVLFILHSITL